MVFSDFAILPMVIRSDIVSQPFSISAQCLVLSALYILKCYCILLILSVVIVHC